MTEKRPKVRKSFGKKTQWKEQEEEIIHHNGETRSIYSIKNAQKWKWTVKSELEEASKWKFFLTPKSIYLIDKRTDDFRGLGFVEKTRSVKLLSVFPRIGSWVHFGLSQQYSKNAKNFNPQTGGMREGGSPP